MSKLLTSKSKFLSLVLRHQPQLIGLSLNEEGWADLDQLVTLSKQHGQDLDRELVLEIVRTCNKQRYAVDLATNKIRANQGHSIAVDLKLQASKPPAILFHGTASRFIASIMEQGLLPGSRQHVHLSASEETAIDVGQRHGSPVVLEVDANSLHKQGQPFYLAENGVWLSGPIAVKFLKRKESKPKA